MKVVFFGSSPYVIPIIQKLRDNFELCLVVTTEGSKEHAVPAFCIANGIPYISVEDFSDETIQRIKECNAEVGILGYFGVILSHEILNIFPKGIINTHPSLLPKYRGPTPVQTAILEGEKETGITIIKLVEDVDAGPILAQKAVEIAENDTTDTLHERLFTMSADIVVDVLKNKLQGIPQDNSKATSTEHLTRQSGYFEANNPPSKEKLDRMIRAYFPWPTAWTKAKLTGKREVTVKFLPGEKIQVEGKKSMSYKDFINGYIQGDSFLRRLNVL